MNDELEKENNNGGSMEKLEERLKTANIPRNIPSPNVEMEQNNNEANEDAAEDEYEDDAEEEEEEEEDRKETEPEKDAGEKFNSGKNHDEVIETPKHVENISNHNHEKNSKDHQENHFDTHEAPHVEDEDVEGDNGHHEMKRSLEPVSKSGSEDHDDDDVHVRGESESEYEELHKAETADVLDVEKMKNSNTIGIV